MTDFSPVVFALLALIGSFFAWKGIKSLIDLIRYLSASAPRTATAGDFVRTQGIVISDETVDSLVSQSPCLGYLAVLEQRYRDRFVKRWHQDYVVGNISEFTIRSEDEEITIDLTNIVRENDSTSALLDLDPPGSLFSPLQLNVDERSSRLEVGTQLPKKYEVFTDVRRSENPARISEYQIEKGDSLTIAGRLTQSKDSQCKIKYESLTVLSDDSQLSTLIVFVQRSLIWVIISLLFIVPAALHLYVSLYI